MGQCSESGSVGGGSTVFKTQSILIGQIDRWKSVVFVQSEVRETGRSQFEIFLIINE